MKKEGELWGLETPPRFHDVFDEENNPRTPSGNIQSYSKYKRNILDECDMDVR
jgi:hypothetical protein